MGDVIGQKKGSLMQKIYGGFLVILGIAITVGTIRCKEIYDGYKMCQGKEGSEDRILSYLEELHEEVTSGIQTKAKGGQRK